MSILTYRKSNAERILKELRIPAEVINNFENITFHGDVSIVSTEEELKNAMFFLQNESRVGFDTESRPAFLKWQKFPVAIVQIATLEKVFIFQFKKLGFHTLLREFLSSPKIEKIGVGLRDDIRRLSKLGEFIPTNFIDLSEIAKSKGIIQTGVRALTARYLQRKLIKSSRKTNWSKTHLTEQQIRYAATDAWVCLIIIDLLKSDTTDYFAQAASEITNE